MRNPFNAGPPVATEPPPKFPVLPEGNDGIDLSLSGTQHPVDLRFFIPADLVSGLDAAGVQLVLDEHERQRAEYEASRPPPPKLPDQSRKGIPGQRASLQHVAELLMHAATELRRFADNQETPS